MKIAVCESEKFYQDAFVDKIKNYDEDMKVDVFEDGESLLEQFEIDKYDMMFLDYYMKPVDGITTAGIIREMDQKVAIIFVANDRPVMYKEVNAMQRIDKTISQEKFNSIMEKAIKWNRNSKDFIYVHRNGKKIIINQNNICYIKETNKIFFDEFDIVCDENLQMDIPWKFYKTEDGYQINFHKIYKLKFRRVIMKRGDCIDLGFLDYLKLFSIYRF